MELPKGINKSIECPVVTTYKAKAKGKGRTLPRPKPTAQSGIQFNPNVSMYEIEKFWILSALDYCGGYIQRAADMIGVSKETMYRKIREYNR